MNKTFLPGPGKPGEDDITTIVTEPLLWARHCSRQGGHRNEQRGGNQNKKSLNLLSFWFKEGKKMNLLEGAQPVNMRLYIWKHLLPLVHGALAASGHHETLLEKQVLGPNSGLRIQKFWGWGPWSLPDDSAANSSEGEEIGFLELGIQGLITVGGGWAAVGEAA